MASCDSVKKECQQIEKETTCYDYDKIKQEVKKIIDKYGPTNRKFTLPYQLAKGPSNEVIVRDCSTKQLVVFDEHFQSSHVFGGAGNGRGKFQSIAGIALDNRKRHLYISDSLLHCIQKFTLNGGFISQFGCKGTANSQFKTPHGVVFSQSELLFVCDKDNNRIQVFKNEQFSYLFGQQGTEPGAFKHPVDVTLNKSEDRLFIADFGNDRIQVFSPEGQFLEVFGNFTGVSFKLQSPVCIHYTPDRRLLISSCGTDCVLVFEEDGRFTTAIEGTFQDKKRFSRPCGVVMMDDGQVVIADQWSNRLVVF